MEFQQSKGAGGENNMWFDDRELNIYYASPYTIREVSDHHYEIYKWIGCAIMGWYDIKDLYGELLHNASSLDDAKAFVNKYKKEINNE